KFLPDDFITLRNAFLETLVLMQGFHANDPVSIALLVPLAESVIRIFERLAGFVFELFVNAPMHHQRGDDQQADHHENDRHQHFGAETHREKSSKTAHTSARLMFRILIMPGTVSWTLHKYDLFKESTDYRRLAFEWWLVVASHGR